MLEDRFAVSDLAVLYSTLLDARDWEGLNRCFTGDAVVVYPEFGEVRGLQQLRELLDSALTPLDATQHIVTNITVDLNGDEARMTSYGQAQHVRNAATGGGLFVMAGTYHDDVVRTSSGWRICRRKMTAAWYQGNRGVFV